MCIDDRFVQIKNTKTGRYLKIDREAGMVVSKKPTYGAYKGVKIVGGMENPNPMVKPSNWHNDCIIWKDDKYSVSELVEHSKKFKKIKCPVECLNFYYSISEENLVSQASAMIRVLNADISYPIILAPDGFLLDGRHRLVKHLMLGSEFVDVVRLDTMVGSY